METLGQVVMTIQQILFVIVLISGATIIGSIIIDKFKS
jgi:hypothetical protein